MSYKKNKFSKALNHDLNIYKCILNFISTLMNSFKTKKIINNFERPRFQAKIQLFLRLIHSAAVCSWLDPALLTNNNLSIVSFQFVFEVKEIGCTLNCMEVIADAIFTIFPVEINLIVFPERNSPWNFWKIKTFGGTIVESEMKMSTY